MEIKKAPNGTDLFVDGIALVRLCEETNKILGIDLLDVNHDFDSDGDLRDLIEWEVLDYLDAESEFRTFGGNIWTSVHPQWDFVVSG